MTRHIVSLVAPVAALVVTLGLALPVFAQEPVVAAQRLTVTLTVGDGVAWVPLVVVVGAPSVGPDERCLVELEYQRLDGGTWKPTTDLKSLPSAAKKFESLATTESPDVIAGRATPFFVRNPTVIANPGRWRVRVNAAAVVSNGLSLEMRWRGESPWAEFSIVAHAGNQALVERALQDRAKGNRGAFDVLADLFQDDPTTSACESMSSALTARLGGLQSATLDDLPMVDVSPGFRNWVGMRQCLDALLEAEQQSGNQRAAAARVARAKLEALPADYLPAVMTMFLQARLEAVDRRADAGAVAALRSGVRDGALPRPKEAMLRAKLLRLGVE